MASMNPTTLPAPTFQQWQHFVPQQNSMNPFDQYHSEMTNQNIFNAADKTNQNLFNSSQVTNKNLYDGTDRINQNMFQGNQYTNKNITDGTEKIVGGLNESTQYLTAGVNGISKDLSASSLGLRDAIERGNMLNGNAIERTSGDIRLNSTILDAANRQASNDSIRDVLRAVDANGGVNGATTERVGANLNSTVERTASQIERLAGEGRLTTTVTDAASRQASNDGIRDVLRSLAVTDTAVERTAGETRSNFLNSMNTMSSIIADSRHTVTDQVNRGTNEMVNAMNKHADGLTNVIAAAASESRIASNINLLELTKGTNLLGQQSASHFSNILLEQQKSAAILAQQSAGQFSNAMLEQQKIGSVLGHDNATHYASLMMEQQRVKEYLSSKGDSQFAMGQLELHKVKEGITFQAAQNFSSLQLEASKTAGLISAQLAEAKYDGLKNTQFLADKMCECCCEVKQKIDGVDRDRLRDHLIVEKGETNLLKIAEFFDRRRSDSPRRRSNSPPRR